MKREHKKERGVRVTYRTILISLILLGAVFTAFIVKYPVFTITGSTISEINLTMVPSSQNNSINFSNAVFNCSASSTVTLVNISLYSDYNNGWKLIETKSITGSLNSTTFTKDILTERGINNTGFIDASFKWNCLAYDSNSQSGWAAQNSTFSSWDLGAYEGTETDNENVTLITNTTQISIYSNTTYLPEAYTVQVQGDYAYVTPSGVSGYVEIVNITDRSNPVHAGNYTNSTYLNTPRFTDISGDYFYVPALGDDRFTIINVSDKANPTFVSSFQNSSALDTIWEIYVDGDYAYVTARGNTSLVIINVSDKTNPYQVGFFANASSMATATGVYASGDYAYVTSYNNKSLVIINITDKTNPYQVGSYVNTLLLNQARRVIVDGDYAYVISYAGDSLVTINVSDKTNPTLLSSYNVSTDINGPVFLSLSASGKYAYVGAQVSNKVDIFDVSNKTNISLVNSYPTTVAWGGTAEGGYIYVAQSTPLAILHEPYRSGSYTSRIFDAGNNVSYNNISWKSTLPNGTNITIQTRTSEDNLTWTSWSSNHSNPSGLINNHTRYFQYRANFTNAYINRTSYLEEVNISYSEIDPPSIQFVNNTTLAGNFSQSFIEANITASDNVSLDTIKIFLYNSTGLYQANYSSAGQFSINFTNLTDGTYYLNATANDSSANLNQTETRAITLDTTPPTVTFTCAPSSVTVGDTVTCTCSAEDSGVGVNTSSISDNLAVVTSASGNFNVGGCSAKDLLNNSASATGSYTVNAVSSGGGGGGGGSASTSETAKKSSIINAKPGQEIRITSFKETGIKEILIIINKSVPRIDIDVVKYENKPENITKELEGKRYGYIHINTENLNENLREAKVQFEVNKSWASDNGLGKDDISIFKFDETNEKWNELNTTYESEESGKYIYSVKLNSFSFFAIGEKLRGTQSVISNIADSVTESYESAGKTIVGLILWWLIFSILSLGIVVVSLLIISQFKKEKPANNIQPEKQGRY